MPPVCFLYQICELCNAMFFSQLSYMWIMHRHGARHHICELSHAIFFFITYSICQQSMYIQLLFMCISHLSWLWKNLEWKQGLQSRQWYLLKHISRWLQGALQRRIQRQMTSPILESIIWFCHVILFRYSSYVELCHYILLLKPITIFRLT